MSEAMCKPLEYQVTENFNFKELIHSNTAVAKGINNIPSDEVHKNLVEACINLWQPTREILGVPMKVHSAYRSEALNKAIGGSKTSAHVYGLAMDFTAPQFGTTTQIAKKLVNEFKTRGIKFDQIILEYPKKSTGGWIHLGYKSRAGQQRGQTLLINQGTGYQLVDFNKLV